MALPHSLFLQVLGVPEQAKLSSTRHEFEQPSPLVVLLSSQFSVPVILPSPQRGTQRLPGTRHWKPLATVLQSAEHPSSPLVLPSSQVSVLESLPSPHLTEETQA